MRIIIVFGPRSKEEKIIVFGRIKQRKLNSKTKAKFKNIFLLEAKQLLIVIPLLFR